MSVIEPTDDWRQELSPWLAALMEIKHALKVELPAMPTSEILESLWIRFETRDGMSYGPLQWAMILEAWELLDLLVRVDAVAGWQCLFSVVVQPRTLRTFAGALFPYHRLLPRYKLGGIKSDTTGPFLQSLFLVMRRMIGEDDQPWAPPSPEFVRVKQLLLTRGHAATAAARLTVDAKATSSSSRR